MTYIKLNALKRVYKSTVWKIRTSTFLSHMTSDTFDIYIIHMFAICFYIINLRVVEFSLGI